MPCERVVMGSGVAYLCSRGHGGGRRICDICDRSASGAKEQLRVRDGARESLVPFDVCVRCRERVRAARGGHRAADWNDRPWVTWAAERITESLAGKRPDTDIQRGPEPVTPALEPAGALT